MRASRPDAAYCWMSWIMEPVEKETTTAAVGPATRIPWYLVVLRARRDLGVRRWLLGHRVAPFDRTRLVLVSATRRDLCVRCARGPLSAYLILSTTFLPGSAFRHVSVRIWGLSGPLGAFASAWGGLMMLVSAPFDNWWHNAYGLDVRIISPPHMVLAAGFFGIEVGTILLALAFMNRASGSARIALRRLFCTSQALPFANRSS